MIVALLEGATTWTKDEKGRVTGRRAVSSQEPAEYDLVVGEDRGEDDRTRQDEVRPQTGLPKKSDDDDGRGKNQVSRPNRHEEPGKERQSQGPSPRSPPHGDKRS